MLVKQLIGKENCHILYIITRTLDKPNISLKTKQNKNKLTQQRLIYKKQN